MSYSFRLVVASFMIYLLLTQCNEKPQETKSHPKLKMSLAQWSFHLPLRAGTMSNVDFVRVADSMGFDGVEYVNQFFKDKAQDTTFLVGLKTISAQTGVKNVLIMIDGEGDLGSSNDSERLTAIANHKKWIDAAKHIGCIAIRVNAHGNGSPDDIKKAMVSSLKELSDYAKERSIDIYVENHGGISNNGDWMLDLIKNVVAYGNVYAYPDFDNWCWERVGGDHYDGECVHRYDRYKGVEMLLPYAHALSVKGLQFDQRGEETTIDYKRMMELTHQAAYDHYLGIEYEGEDLNPRVGVQKIMDLVRKYHPAASSKR
jgi:sugar phosphate isomerase/epimerase